MAANRVVAVVSGDAPGRGRGPAPTSRRAVPGRGHRRFASWGVRRGVLVAGLALLGVSAVQGVSLAGQLLGPQAVHQLDERDGVYRCVRDRVERSVPVGATVFVVPDAALWEQRVIESTYPRLRVTATRGTADDAVRVTGSGATCGSVDVTVQRLR